MEPRNWESGASATAPTAPVSPSNGYATEGNPLTATPATNPGAFWFHKIAEELRAVIVAAGETPSDSSLTQLLTALQTMFGTVLATTGVPYGIKWMGLEIQFGSVTFTDVPTGVPGIAGSVVFTSAFPTACQHVVFGLQVASGGSAYNNLQAAVAGAPTATGFSYQVQEWSNAVDPGTLHWLAIGY